MKKTTSMLLCVLCCICLFANTPIKSLSEEYYDYLVLIGRSERSYLTYRTLSNNKYSNINGFWEDKYLENTKQINNNTDVEIYNPQLFTSYNTARPMGQNDGALWQGVGLNAQLKGGASVSYKGLKLTVKPEFDFSQNKEYKTIVTDYNKDYPNNYFWGTWTPYDLPQRFGETSFFTFDFGDSEVRYTGKYLDVGFGTSALWLGPTYLNSILHSNNAGTYPRFDIGLNPTAITIPWIKLPLGEVDFHYSVGMLTKTDYTPMTLKKTLLHLVNCGYHCKYVPSLTLGVTYACHAEFSSDGITKFLRSMIYHNNNTEDAKIAVNFDFLLPESGFECYGEFAMDDYTSPISNIFHTVVEQFGLKKSIDVFEKYGVGLEAIAEIGVMARSRDGFADVISYNHNFYTHYENPGSYTNKGQLIGAGTGYAGNSQYVALNAFYKKGMSTIYLQRSNPDNNYIYALVTHADTGSEHFHFFRGMLDVGVKTNYFVNDKLTLSGAIAGNYIVREQYGLTGDYLSENVFNMHFELECTYTL